MEDQQIVELYWRRDEEAVTETRRKYGGYLTKIADNILASREDGEEAVSDTCLRAWNSIPPDRPESLSAYLGKIVRRVSIDALRRRTRQKRGGGEYALSLSELEECVPGGPGPEEEVELTLLEEANARRQSPRRRAGWLKWAAAAACLALAAGVGLRLARSAENLPRLPLSAQVGSPGGMGFEGYLAHDVSELVSGTPWRESDNFRTLPVYRNSVVYDRAGAPPAEGVDLEAMRSRALEAAGRLGIDAQIQDNAPTEEEIAAVKEKLGGDPRGVFCPYAGDRPGGRGDHQGGGQPGGVHLVRAGGGAAPGVPLRLQRPL